MLGFNVLKFFLICLFTYRNIEVLQKTADEISELTNNQVDALN